MDGIERYDTIVIGGGQAGLSAGYHLSRRGARFVILEARERVGDVWRGRYDSLRLFSPAFTDGLPGWPYPAKPWTFPTKDELASYFEAYAKRFALPVRTGIRVTRVSKRGSTFVVETGGPAFEAENVILATGLNAVPRLPDFALDLDPRILQLHAAEYRNPGMLRPGGVLVVGAGNSGAEIALEIARSHHTLLSGTYHRMKIGPSRSPIMAAIAWAFLTYVATIRTPLGRKMKAKMGADPKAPVERVSAEALAAAGVERVPRTVRVDDGRPMLADGRIADVANVIWCTGYGSDLGWVDVPFLDENGEPRHERGVSVVDGLYLVGRWFQYGFTSALIGGVGRDAEFVTRHIAMRTATRTREAVPQPARVG